MTASGETCQSPSYLQNPAYQDNIPLHKSVQYELEVLTTDMEEDVLGQAPENPSLRFGG